MYLVYTTTTLTTTPSAATQVHFLLLLLLLELPFLPLVFSVMCIPGYCGKPPLTQTGVKVGHITQPVPSCLRSFCQFLFCFSDSVLCRICLPVLSSLPLCDYFPHTNVLHLPFCLVLNGSLLCQSVTLQHFFRFSPLVTAPVCF